MRTPTRLRNHQAPRRRRGTQFIEFAILLPVFLVMLMLIVGMGEVVLTQAGLQDALQQVARTGAQQGGLGAGCVTGGVCDASSSAATELANQVSAIPGGDPTKLSAISVTAGGGSECSVNSPYVTVSVTYSQGLSVPGVTQLLNFIAPTWTLHASATARCEVSGGP